MRRVILTSPKKIHPFGEPARDLRIHNEPLYTLQERVLAKYTTKTTELQIGEHLPQIREEMIVYRNNLFFNQGYIDSFIEKAKKHGRACRAAFHADDPAFSEHALPLSTSYTPAGNLYLADLWYYPHGPVADTRPLIIDMQPKEVGYYSVPTYMAEGSGDLVFQVPLRSLLAIDSWVHIFIADVVFGVFSSGVGIEKRLEEDLKFKIKVLGKALYEGRQVLECSELVQIGKNCTIDPKAVIHGPTIIGDNVTIGAGAVVENSIIGNKVNISQDVQVMLSVVGDGTFLPFKASLFMTTIMENSMVAQNTCLQMCVIGRNTFIGAGSTFTDYNLIPVEIRAMDGNNELKNANRPVLGGCVGHNCRIGSGMIVYPARTIESDVVLAATKERRLIDKNISFEESDHHNLRLGHLHETPYHKEEDELESW
ncbi:MAG: multidrug transporter [Anaerolineae bacterium]|jgi:UDP-N-acetylglucosamine diphosphorylase / glucose-1-phosphate thymidylyltransferase / UDP-N-acetylgalactosamine diphosphorylase / glucosamine-1-phosphate N-acetyltransferase / galactosamine-1-phosphate N-acetyltransferase|nr:multidrug transporter [Anaerolineae bacterium]MBT7074803.1 multidrug transporter [Anaerolineae bacterium]MBT7782819.1 multidrug transporter [Anaerolineae bacterium]